MTAPATEQTETLDPMEQTIVSTLTESKDLLGTGDEAEDQKVRDERGRFVAQHGDKAAIPEAVPAQDAAPTTEETVPEPVIPEGYVAAKPLDETKVQGFKVFDADGEIIPPDLKFQVNFRDEAGPRELSLDKLVNFARNGVYNHQREQQVVQAQQELQRVSTVNQQLIDYARRLESEREQMLTSDDVYLATRAQYEQENTPQARLARLEEQRRQEQTTNEIRGVQQEWVQYVEGPLTQAADTILKTLPGVTQDELGARLTLVTTRFAVPTQLGPVIPRQNRQALEQAIVQEVVPWAQQLHEEREHQKTIQPKPPADTKKVADEAAVKVQRVKRQAAPAIRPTNGVAATTQPKPVRTSKDAEDAVIGRTKAALGLAG